MMDGLGLLSLAGICVLLAGAVIHFARPLALSAQETAAIQVRATVVAPGPLEETRHAIEAALEEAKAGLNGSAGQRVRPPWPRLAPRGGLPVALLARGAQPPSGARVEQGTVVALLEWEEGRAVVTAADLSR